MSDDDPLAFIDRLNGRFNAGDRNQDSNASGYTNPDKRGSGKSGTFGERLSMRDRGGRAGGRPDRPTSRGGFGK